MSFTFILEKQIPSGKNQQHEYWLNGRKILRPDRRFETWRKEAAWELKMQTMRLEPRLRSELPLRRPLKLTVRYHEQEAVPAHGTRDLPGLMDALLHLLEYNNIVANDGHIVACDWAIAPAGPCVTVTLEGA